MESKLTKENYATNHDYLSYSRINKYIKCEAAALANYSEPSSPSQLIGSYVDAYFSNEMDEFLQKHSEVINKKNGQLKSEYVKADNLIKRIESDETFMHYMSGEKQYIMTGTICDMPFKIKMDSYLKDEAIVDLKVLKDFSKIWSDSYKCYMNFIEGYNYDIELAIFQEIVYQNTGKKLPCYLACITKEEPSDIGIFYISQEKLDKALNIVKNRIPRIKKLMSGEETPHRCGRCAYCRMTKKAKVINSDFIDITDNEIGEL